ncbi:MAG: hypothetical protein WDM87_00185 [Terracidiphilus sp.]
MLSALAERIPVIAAGASLPVLLFGITDWITWSYPWQSFVLYYKENVVSGPGKELTIVQPWYWYALVLLVLLGPAVLLLFHGTRRSPFLAIFCAIIVVSHSVIPHKEIRFIYPILAPAITLAAMGIVDLLQEIKHGLSFLDNPRWVVAIGIAFFPGLIGAARGALRGLVQNPLGRRSIRSPQPRAPSMRSWNLPQDMVGVGRVHASSSQRPDHCDGKRCAASRTTPHPSTL